MKIKRRDLKKLIENYLFEQEDADVEADADEEKAAEDDFPIDDAEPVEEEEPVDDSGSEDAAKETEKNVITNAMQSVEQLITNGELQKAALEIEKLGKGALKGITITSGQISDKIKDLLGLSKEDKENPDKPVSLEIPSGQQRLIIAQQTGQKTKQV